MAKAPKLTKEELDQEVLVEVLEDVEFLEWKLLLRKGDKPRLKRYLLEDERMAGKFKEI